MQISLQEDDGIFHGGIPTMVVIVVQFDDGRTQRLPYPADKSISSLYQDLYEIAPKVAQSSANIQLKPIETFKKVSVENIPLVDKSKIIEKEDFVRLIRIDEGRNKEHSFLLVVGQELRVISVISQGVTLPGHDYITKVIQGYDVVDDQAARPERTRLFPHEVELSRKRVSPIIPKVSQTEEILPCPDCSVPNSLALIGNDFKGNCTACQADICIGRIIRECGTERCRKDKVSVSCFDVGGKYQGKCTMCGSPVEVPYV